MAHGGLVLRVHPETSALVGAAVRVLVRETVVRVLLAEGAVHIQLKVRQLAGLGQQALMRTFRLSEHGKESEKSHHDGTVVLSLQVGARESLEPSSRVDTWM